MEIASEIICAGEILWDSLPAGLFLGGAPFNVVRDLRMLGIDARIASRIGRDFLGKEIIRRLALDRIPEDLIQIDDKLPTGIVEVELDAAGDPVYDIKGPVAWDAFELSEEAVRAVSASNMLVFGTLASRSLKSRETIRSLIKSARTKVLDVNLRPGATSMKVVGELIASADIVKVNAQELEQIRKAFVLPADSRHAAEELARKFSCEMVCISEGDRGGKLWHNGSWFSHPGFRTEVVSSVGAGDAFLAGLLASILRGKSDEESLETANLAGAFVVTKQEASPPFSMNDLDRLREKTL